MTTKDQIPNWNNGKPFVVVESMLTFNWAGRGRLAFSCGLCNYQFEAGDTARWVFINGVPNIFVCPECDSPNISEIWRHQWEKVISPIVKRWG